MNVTSLCVRCGKPEGSPDEPIKPEALRAIARLERRAEHPYSAQLIDMAATEIERLRSANDLAWVELKNIAAQNVELRKRLEVQNAR